MQKHDARKLTPDALHERRQQVIRLLNCGESRAQIGVLTELSPTAVAKIIRLYEQGGLEALKPLPRGRKPGADRRLTPEQETLVQQIICNFEPAQRELPYLVWHREAIKELVEKEFGISLAIRTVGHYLKRWNFTLKKSAKKPRRTYSPDHGLWQCVRGDLVARTRGYVPKTKATHDHLTKMIDQVASIAVLPDADPGRS